MLTEEPTPSRELRAQLVIEPERSDAPQSMVATASLVNTGATPLTLDLTSLAAPALALEIEDAKGAAVPLPPPPVPGGEAVTTNLAPGGTYTTRFVGFVPHWIPAGDYRARLHYACDARTSSPGLWSGEVVSDWVGFHIVA